MNAKNRVWKKNFSIVILILLIIVLSANSLGISDSDNSNNVKNVAINVIETQLPTVVFTHVVENSSDSLKSDYQKFVSQSINYSSLVLPFRDSTPYLVMPEEKYLSLESFLRRENISAGDPFNPKLLQHIELLTKLSMNNMTYTVGVVSFGFATRFLGGADGRALRDGTKAVFLREELNEEDLFFDEIAAHEIGHAFQLCDEKRSLSWSGQNADISCPNGGNEDNTDLNSSCIGTYGIENLSGCPVDNESLLMDIFYSTQNLNHLVNLYGSQPRPNSDFRRWPNRQTYSRMLTSTTGVGNVICRDEDLIVMSGDITKSFEVNLQNFYIIDGGCYFNRTLSSNSSDSLLKISLRGDGGEVLTSFSQKLTFISIADGNETTDIEEMPFVFTVPVGNASSFEFLNQSNNVTLAERNKTPNNPNITIGTTLEGKVFNSSFNITWNASDADNDTIFYALLISSDNGSTYTTIDFDINQTFYELDNADFAYGTKYKAKVLATDGVNTGTDISAGTFTILPPPKITVQNVTLLQQSGSQYYFDINIINDGGQVLNDSTWKLNLDGEAVTSNINFSLNRGEQMNLIVNYNASSNDLLNVTATGINNPRNLTGQKTLLIDPPSVDVKNFGAQHVTTTTGIFHFELKNDGQRNLAGANYTVNMKDGQNVTSLNNISLDINESVEVFIEHDFQEKGKLNIEAKAFSNKYGFPDTETIQITMGDILIHSLQEEHSNNNYKIFTFNILNNLNTTVNNISWSLDTQDGTSSLVESQQDIALNANETTNVLFEHNYTNTGNYTITAEITNGTSSDTEVLNVEVK